MLNSVSMPVLRPPKPLSGKASESRRSRVGGGSRLPFKSFPGRWSNLPRHTKKKIIQIGITAVLVGIVLLVGFVAWVSQDLPDPNKLSDRSVAQSTKIYARDGATLLFEIHGDQRRTLVDLDQVGKYTKDATLAIEDKDFYNHGGISLRGTLRAIFVDLLTGSRSQGGSTITQQLVKNAILTNEKSVVRKVKEWVLAYQIERRFTKDQILKLYFNEIPYGSNAYGVEAAAQTYFNKHAKDLDLPESALLAAILPAPSYYSPRGNHTDEVLDRWKLVLDLMRQQKKITKDQEKAAVAVDILSRISPSKDKIIAPHFVFYVRDYLEKKYGTSQLERGGLKVVTTLDPDLQKIAEEEVAAGAERNEARYKASNASLVAIEPKSGQLLAMVGSRDYFDSAHDGNFNVATALRNPGSSFKPIVYLTAFMKGYTPATVLFDLKTDFGPDGSGKDFSPDNYDFKEHGPLQMRQTLDGSLNIPAVKTLYLAGIPSTVDTAEKLGYTTLDRSKLGLALAIGGGAVRLIEHVSAFATLANDGVRNPTTALLRVEDAKGKILELYQDKSERVLPEEPVRELDDVLSDNGARAFVFGAHNLLTLPGRKVAAKTGTTNDFVDGWTMGFTPQLAAGVWVGNNDNSPMRSGADGSIVAAPIWNAFMKRALEGDPAVNFPGPKPSTTTKPVLNSQYANKTTLTVDSVTGKRIPDSCVDKWPAAYKKTVTLSAVHSILYYVQKDDPQGDPPSDPSKDPMFDRWEAPVQAWAKDNGYLSKAPADELCSLRVGSDKLSVSISSPKQFATITAATLPITMDVLASAGTKTLTVALDGNTVTTLTGAPYTASIDLSKTESGFHTILATLTNTNDETTTSSVTINYLPGSASATTYIISPAPGSTIDPAAFPVTVTAFAYDPAEVSTVTLYQKNADGKSVVVDSVSSPTTNTVTFSWPAVDPGTYQLYVVMKNGSGKTTQSDDLGVTVTK